MATIDLTPLLSVTDPGAGTSVAVTGSGFTPAIPLLIYRATWNAEAGSRWTWVSTGASGLFTPDGSGNISGTITGQTPGFYSWMAVQELASSVKVTSGVFRPIIDPADPVHLRILDAVVTLIRSLNLSGIGSASNKVFRRWFPRYLTGTDDDVSRSGGQLPMIIAGPYPSEVPMGYLTNRDDVGYPVLVGMYDNVGPLMDNDMSRNLKWRRQIAAAFRAQQLAGVSEVVLTDWQPGPIAPPEGIDKGYLVGSMSFLFRSRETRGLIA